MKAIKSKFKTISIISIMLMFICLTTFQKMQAQNVGIGATSFTPAGCAILDVTSTSKGMLIPRMTSAQRGAISSPVEGLLVYETPSDIFYYYDGGGWKPLLSSSAGWNVTGNAGTSATTNFVGTTDANDFVMRTNNTERMRIKSSGYVGIGTTTPMINFQVDNGSSANLTSGGYMMLGDVSNYSMVMDRDDIMARNNGNPYDLNLNRLGGNVLISASNAAGRVGIGTSSPTQMLTVYKGMNIDQENINPGTLTNALIFGDASSSVEGIASKRTNGGNQYGLDFYTGNSNKMCITWGGSVGIGTTSPSGMLHVENASSSRAAYIHNSLTTNSNSGLRVENDGTGYGISCAAAGSSTTGIYCTQGGVTPWSSIGISCSDPTAPGNSSTVNYTTGKGISSGGTNIGVEGYAQEDGNTGTDQIGGAFYVKSSTGTTAAFACVGAIVDDLQYKIIGQGTVATIVNDTEEKPVVMTCPETPEVLFQDFGTGQLVNGNVHITLDPILAKNITVNERHPVKIFIQLDDECNGVFVKNKKGNGFDVVELGNGKSNAKFSWMLTATRKNETRGGVTSDYEGFRFKRTSIPYLNQPEATRRTGHHIK